MASIRLSIQRHGYSTISVCPLRCLSSTLCTFYSIRMDPLTKTCFCGLVIKAIQSSKNEAYSIQHFYWVIKVWVDVWSVCGCYTLEGCDVSCSSNAVCIKQAGSQCSAAIVASTLQTDPLLCPVLTSLNVIQIRLEFEDCQCFFMYKFSHQFIWDNNFGKTARANHLVYKCHIKHLYFSVFSVFSTIFIYLYRLERKYALFDCCLKFYIQLYLLL